MTREEGVQRLYPSIANSRYYYLIQLRKAIEAACKSFLSKGGKDLILIDYGCGNKPYEPVVKPFVKDYIGVDLPENPNAHIHIDPKGKIDLKESSVDIVLSTQVLEHVEDPYHYLSEARRVLKPGGQLLLSTHGYWIYHPDTTDYLRWTSAGLKKIIAEEGFEILSFKGIIGRSAMGIQLFQDGIILKLPKFIRPFLSVFFQPLIALFDKIGGEEAKNRDACTFIVVARKNV